MKKFVLLLVQCSLMICLAVAGPAPAFGQSVAPQGPAVDLGEIDFGGTVVVGFDEGARGVVVFERFGSLVAQRLDATGQPVGAEIEVAEQGAEVHRLPSLAVASDGSFTVAWEAFPQFDFTGRSVYGRSYGADGTALGPIFPIATSGNQWNGEPTVSRRGAGLLVVWRRVDGEDTTLVGRRSTAAGAAEGSEIVLARATAGERLERPRLTALDDGRFGLVWRQEVHEESLLRWLAMARSLGTDGGPVGAAFEVGEVRDFGEYPAVAAGIGEWMVATSRDHGLRLRRLANDGVVLGELSVGPLAGGARQPSVASDAFGRYLLSWTGLGPTSSDQVFVRQVVGGAFLGAAHQATSGGQVVALAAAGHGDAEYMVAWRRDSDNRLFVQRWGKAPGALAWEAPEARVTEGAPSLAVRVVRGGLGGPVSVRYRTEDGTARAGEDYRSVEGILTWAEDDLSPRTVIVPILDGGDQEPQERFFVRLHDPTDGSSLAEPSRVEVRVLDDDGHPEAEGGDEVVSTAPSARAPQVAVDATGRAVVAWDEDVDEDDVQEVMIRFFSASGAPQGPGVSLGDGGEPAVARAPSGGVVVAWASGDGVVARRLDASGNFSGAPIWVDTSPTAGPTGGVDVAMDAAGGFVVVWTGSADIAARRFDPAGQPLGPAFVVHEQHFPVQRRPRVAVRDDGSFLVVWEDERKPDLSPPQVHARLFGADGAAIGAERPVSADGEAGQYGPDAAAFPDGSFLVVWQGVGGLEEGIGGRRLAADGSPVGDDLIVNTFDEELQIEPRVDIGGDGVAVVVWSSGNDTHHHSLEGDAQDGNFYGVFGQRFDAEGRRIGAEFPVNAVPEGSQVVPAVASAPSGDFLVAWQEEDWLEEGFGFERAGRGVAMRWFAGGSPVRGTPQPPQGEWLSSAAVPGFDFKVLITGGSGSIAGVREPSCIPETVCVSGALAGRSEVFLRVLGPKPNGRLWPTLVKFSTSMVEVWVRQDGSGEVLYYRLEGARPGVDELPGLFDRTGFAPVAASAASASTLAGAPLPASGGVFTSEHFPDYRFRARISSGDQVQEVRKEPACIEETLCLSGAIPGRSEVFLRIVGPKPNGRMWPTIVKFTTSTLEVWIEQISTGEERYYRIEGAAPGKDDLTGLFDRTGFAP